jgi:hypothetical protein
LESVFKQTGIKPDQLQQLEFPECFRNEWVNFKRLRSRAGSNGFGLNPISWHDFESFMNVTRVVLSNDEIEVIEALDIMYINFQASLNKKED